jgi:hypothetical protein
LTRPDFFDDATAVFPVLIVTKSLVSIIHKRQPCESVLHVICIVVATGGMFIALGAATLDAPKAWQERAVWLTLALSVLILVIDLIAAEHCRRNSPSGTTNQDICN